MRLFICLLITLASTVFAQYQLDQTPPFNLIISSSNTTINGSRLYSCHEGAAIEALCLTSTITGPSTEFRLNYTARRTVDPVLGITGLLTWVLYGTNFNLSSPMKISYSPISNVAIPLFLPLEDGTIVGFDHSERMYIPAYTQDTRQSNVTDVMQYRSWFACDTKIGYNYKTLAWVVGIFNPDNPTCQKVEVVRKFIGS